VTLAVRELSPWERVREPLLTEACAAEAALTGVSSEQMVNDSIALSWQAYEASYDGEPVAYWGHTPRSILSTSGFAWMLVCPGINKAKILAARKCKLGMEEMLELYSDVTVAVDLRHKVAVNWLRWLGFMPAGQCPPFTLMRAVREESGSQWEG